jgi:hypothetical protein
MHTSYFEDWFQKRLEIADDIVSKHGMSAVSDAEIILFCAASSLAAILWPRNTAKRPIDKKRFVQFLIEYSSKTCPSLNTISVDLLIRHLLNESNSTEAKILIEKFYRSEYAYYSKSPTRYYDDGPRDIEYAAGTLSNIYYPHEIDVTEEKILKLTPGVSRREIRKCSYANVIYSDLRSGLVHEYEPTGNVAEYGWNKSNDGLAYINNLIMPDENEVKKFAGQYKIEMQEARDALSQTRRSIYFPYNYIRDAIISAAKSLFEYWKDVPGLSRTEPDDWWIDGSQDLTL